MKYGPKARLAISLRARGLTLRSPSLLRAWSRLSERGQTGSAVRSWRTAHPFKLTRERDRPRKRKPGSILEPPQRSKKKKRESEPPAVFHYAGSTRRSTRSKKGRGSGGVTTREFQIDVKSKRPLTRKQINEAIEYRAVQQENPPGVIVRVTSWSSGHGTTERKIRDEEVYWEDIGRVIAAGNYSGTSADSKG